MPDDLDILVRDVRELTGAEGPGVMEADAPVLRVESATTSGDDGYYIVGLIGGKEVGKTALANALVGQPMSRSTSFGPGTETVIAYVHEAQAKPVAALLEREVPGRFQIVTHTAPRLFHQVLLDLPDIDSLYSEHVEITRRMLRHMLFPVWIQSVEKYADQQPQKLLAAVASGNDPANFVFCLNKVDQVVRAEGPRAAIELRDDYARRIAHALNLPHPPKVHLISATHPDEHDLPSLRAVLSQQKTPQAVKQSTELAVRHRARSVLRWLDNQRLDQYAGRLQRLEREAEELTASRIAVPLMEQSIPRLLNDPSHRLSIVEEVMNRRVARWPIVNVLHVLLAPLTGLWRRNVASSAAPTPEGLVAAHVDADRPLVGAIQTTFGLLQQSHPTIGPLYRDRRLWDELPSHEAAADLRAALAHVLERQRTTAVERIGGRGGVVGTFVRWLLTIGAVVWFPFVQPILEALLESSWTMVTADLLILVVRLFSAAYLLECAAFLTIWFVFLWLVVRWDTNRRAMRLMTRWQQADPSDPTLSPAATVMEWLDGLLDPIHRSRRHVERLTSEVSALRRSLDVPAA